MDDDQGTSPTGVFLEAIHSTLAGENVRLHTDSRARVHAIAAVHLLVSEHQLRQLRPISSDLTTLLTTAASVSSLSSIVDRLLPLARAHDDIAAGRYEPVLPDIPYEVDEDDGLAVKIVRLVRNNEPLGATIKCQPDGCVRVARVMRGGVADRSGCIQVGDRVIEVNGVAVTGKQPPDIVLLLAECERTVTFKLVPAGDDSLASVLSDQLLPSCSTNVRMRALFDYEPSRDPLHPCVEAGMTFRRGDIFELVDAASDDSWWQVRHETMYCTRLPAALPDNANVGRVVLIPSKKFMEKQNAALLINGDNAVVRKNSDDSSGQSTGDTAAMRTYEQVALLTPQPAIIRTIVLIGPPGVGRNELQRRLLLLNPDRFGTTVPHTSRSMKAGEVDGVDYHFVDRPTMENHIKRGAFIEYGEYRGNLYGTLLHSVTALIAQGRTPVLTPHCQALRALRCVHLRPFVVFVRPPPFPTLKETRGNSRGQVRHAGYTRSFTDAELQAMIAAAAQLSVRAAGARAPLITLQQNYGHLVDYELVNGSLEFAFRELCDVLQRVDTQPQWVPQAWTRAQM